MKTATDIELIEMIKTKNCSDALIELSDRHGGIVFDISKKYLKNGSFSQEDLNSNKLWIVYISSMSFDVSKKTKFSTWLANQTRYFCLNAINKLNKNHFTPEHELEYLNHINHSDNNSSALENLKDLLELHNDENVKKAIYYRYFYDSQKILNYSEVGDILNVTPQTVLNWHNKFIRFAKKKLLTKCKSITTI